MGICGSSYQSIKKPKNDDPEYSKVKQNFKQEEVDFLFLIFEELATRSPDDNLDKDTFLSFFP